MINKRYLLFYSLTIFITAGSLGQGVVTRSKRTNSHDIKANSSNQSVSMKKKEISTNKGAHRDAIIKNLIDNLVYVEGGSFMMGSDDSEASDKEKPSYQVNVNSFLIGKYEVTQKEWDAVMGRKSKTFLFEGDDLPASYLSWNEVNQFIRQLNILSGQNFRLPTEQEWEYAARGGKNSLGYKYSGSNDINKVAWYIDNSGGKNVPVGSKKPNELGLYDMSGSVWEWTSSRDSIYFVYRGGSISSDARECRVSTRHSQTRNWAATFLGFRIAL